MTEPVRERVPILLSAPWAPHLRRAQAFLSAGEVLGSVAKTLENLGCDVTFPNCIVGIATPARASGHDEPCFLQEFTIGGARVRVAPDTGTDFRVGHLL